MKWIPPKCQVRKVWKKRALLQQHTHKVTIFQHGNKATQQFSHFPPFPSFFFIYLSSFFLLNETSTMFHWEGLTPPGSTWLSGRRQGVRPNQALSFHLVYRAQGGTVVECPSILYPSGHWSTSVSVSMLTAGLIDMYVERTATVNSRFLSSYGQVQ